MENERPWGTQYQSITSPSGKYLGRDVHVRRSNRIIKLPQRYDPGFGETREWRRDAVASLFYIIRDVYCDSNVDMDNILFLLYE